MNILDDLKKINLNSIESLDNFILNSGYTLEEISKATGVPVENLEDIRNRANRRREESIVTAITTSGTSVRLVGTDSNGNKIYAVPNDSLLGEEVYVYSNGEPIKESISVFQNSNVISVVNPSNFVIDQTKKTIQDIINVINSLSGKSQDDLDQYLAQTTYTAEQLSLATGYNIEDLNNAIKAAKLKVASSQPIKTPGNSGSLTSITNQINDVNNSISSVMSIVNGNIPGIPFQVNINDLLNGKLPDPDKVLTNALLSSLGSSGAQLNQAANLIDGLLTGKIPDPTGTLATLLLNRLSLSIPSIPGNLLSLPIQIRQFFGYIQSVNRLFGEKQSLLDLTFNQIFPASELEEEISFSSGGQIYKPSSDPSNSEILQRSNLPYADPQGNYPKPLYESEQDTNKLARSEVLGTAAEKKSVKRAYGMPLPEGQSFSQPSNPYAAEYPYNKVFESESGHVIELDDTPNRERINVWHKSGTFQEVDAIGNHVNRIVGSGYTIIDRNGYISIEGKANVSVSGSVNVFVGANANIQVNGDTTLKCGNNITAEAEGKFHISAGEEISMRSKAIYIETEEEMHIRTGKDLKVQSDKGIYIRSEEKTSFESKDNFEVLAAKRVYLDFLEMRMDERLASKVEENEHSFAGLPQKGLTPVEENEIEELVPQMKDESLQYKKETNEDQFSLGQLSSILRKFGVANEKETSEKPSEVVEEPINNRPTQGSTSAPDEEYFKSLTTFPESLKLSQNFTLGSLTTRCAVTSQPLVAQFGLSKGEIATNLQLLAINCLEPIKKRFPDMIVTSGFRNGSNGSQHTKGQAVDIQFKGASKSDYHRIAKEIKDLIPYDQLLLEYKNYGSGNPWIHISYNKNNNRSQVLTFYNNAKYASGLQNLA